jgi:hypothetical protein
MSRNYESFCQRLYQDREKLADQINEVYRILLIGRAHYPVDFMHAYRLEWLLSKSDNPLISSICRITTSHTSDGHKVIHLRFSELCKHGADYFALVSCVLTPEEEAVCQYLVGKPLYLIAEALLRQYEAVCTAKYPHDRSKVDVTRTLVQESSTGKQYGNIIAFVQASFNPGREYMASFQAFDTAESFPPHALVDTKSVNLAEILYNRTAMDLADSDI